MTASQVRGNYASCGGASPGPIPSVLEALALMDEIRGCRPDTWVLMITGRGEHDFAVRASCGALDFIRKPVDVDYSLCCSRFDSRARTESPNEAQELALERGASDRAVR